MWKSLAAARENNARTQNQKKWQLNKKLELIRRFPIWIKHDYRGAAMSRFYDDSQHIIMPGMISLPPAASPSSSIAILILARACVHEHMNGRESRFYCIVQGGWFKSLCRKLTHLLLSEKMFNTIVIPSFSREVRQHIQNLPAQYFLNSGNVPRKFSFETWDCS